MTDIRVMILKIKKLSATAMVLAVCSTGLLSQTSEVSIRVSQSSHDAEEDFYRLTTTDDEIDMGWDRGIKTIGGFTFDQIPVRANAVVQDARIVFTVQETRHVPLTLGITLASKPPVAGFSESSKISSRSVYTDGDTALTILWNIDSANKGDTISTPNLASLLNLRFSEAFWFQGRGATFIIQPVGNAPDTETINELEVYSYDQLNEAYRPQLTLTLNASDVMPLSAEVLGNSPSNCHTRWFLDELVLNCNEPIEKLRVYTSTGSLIQDTEFAPSNTQTVWLRGSAPGMVILEYQTSSKSWYREKMMTLQ
ncbi:MAG: hypothetical protein Kow0075_16450 [Salibacteraceae bacterium]